MASEDTRRAVQKAALWTVSGIFGSRVLGLVRMVVINSAYGAGASGVLRAALNIPDLIFYLVAGGAIRSGFIPVFVDLETKGRDDASVRERAWWLFSAVTTGVFVIGLVLVLLAELCAPWLILPMTGRANDLPLVGPLFGPSADAFTDLEVAQAVGLTRILLPAQIFMLVGGVLAAVLNALKRFEVTSLVPGWYNIAVIGAVILFGRTAEPPLDVVAWGLAFGAFSGQFLWQALEVRRVGRAVGASYRPILSWREPEVRRVLRVAWPIMLGLCAAEVNLKVSSAVIAKFGSEAVSWFDNASRLARLPDGLFGAGLGMALFPFLSQLSSQRLMDRFRQQSELILRLALVAAIPSTVIMVTCAYCLTDALYGHGKYAAAVPDTARLLPYCAIGIIPITLTVVMTRAFYAVEDSLTPLKVGGVSVALGIVANVLLARWLREVGPPLAMGLTSVVNLVGLAWLYGRRIGYTEPARMRSVALRGSVAAIGAGLAARWAVEALDGGKLLSVLVAAGVMFGLNHALLLLFRVEEAREITGILRRRKPSP